MKMKNKNQMFLCFALALSVSTSYARQPQQKLEDTSGLVFQSETKSGDTTIKHKVLQIDEHLVISDTIVIEDTKVIVKTELKDDTSKKWVALSVFLFSIVALIYRKIKREKNESK
jgi:hypothetical protein